LVVHPLTLYVAEGWSKRRITHCWEALIPILTVRVNLAQAMIGGALTCAGSQFIAAGAAPALDFTGTRINGHAFFGENVRADGGMHLAYATIGGGLSCGDGQFVSMGGKTALDASNVKICGDASFRKGFRAEGGMILVNATVGGNLSCCGSQFVNKGESPALNAGGSKIQGSAMFAENMSAEGEVRFAYASVTLYFQSGAIESPEKAMLNLGFAKVGRLLSCLIMKETGQKMVIFSLATLSMIR
jgi:hypothetical protein